MGRLDRKTRTYLADMLLALLARDYRRLAQVWLEAGYLPAGQSQDIFAQALRSISEPLIDRPLNEISFGRLLARLLQLSESFDMPVQPQLLLLQKNMMMAEGVSRRLDPDLNIWTLAEPLIEAWMRENRGPEARLRGAADELSTILERLPGLVVNVEAAAADLAPGPAPASRDRRSPARARGRAGCALGPRDCGRGAGARRRGGLLSPNFPRFLGWALSGTPMLFTLSTSENRKI